MPELGRAALVLCLGLALYALVAGAYAAATRKRRLAALGAERALRGLRVDGRRVGRPARRAAPARLLVHLRRRAHEPRAADAVHDLGLLGRPGGLAPALAARPDRLLRAGGRVRAGESAADLVAWVVPVLGLVATFFAFMLVVVSSPFATQVAPADGAGLNPSLQNPYMMIHPPLSLPRLRRADDPVRVRDGRAARAARRRALDRRHAPLDALRVDGARHRPAARRALGLRRGGLGRLLRLGPGRERRADAVARGDGVPALGDDPGEARAC